MKSKKGLIKKILLIILGIIIVYLIASVVIVNLVYDELRFNRHFDYDSIANARDYNLAARETDLKASDGVRIHIYEVMVSEPKGVVIMLTGITGPSITHFYAEAKLVADAGYASILVDARGHGKSGGDKITFSIEDVKDVDAVVEYIEGQKRYKDIPVIVMGLSMGGATAINAGSTNDNIDGIIALSPFSSWTDVCVETASNSSGIPLWICNMLKPGVVVHGLFTFGLDFFRIAPKETIKNVGDKPILIMRSIDDEIVPIENHDRIMENYTGSNLEYFVREGDNHGVTDISYPFNDMEFCNAILNFLNNFNEEGSVGNE